MNTDQTLTKLRDIMRLKHYAWQTEQCYQGWILRYIEWLEKHGADLPTRLRHPCAR